MKDRADQRDSGDDALAALNRFNDTLTAPESHVLNMVLAKAFRLEQIMNMFPIDEWLVREESLDICNYLAILNILLDEKSTKINQGVKENK